MDLCLLWVNPQGMTPFLRFSYIPWNKMEQFIELWTKLSFLLSVTRQIFHIILYFLVTGIETLVCIFQDFIETWVDVSVTQRLNFSWFYQKSGWSISFLYKPKNKICINPKVWNCIWLCFVKGWFKKKWSCQLIRNFYMEMMKSLQLFL